MNSCKRLEGQTVLITGSSSGIGKGIALAMAKEGANVVINYRSSKTGAEEVKKEIDSLGGKATVIKADVSSEEDVINLFKEAKEAFGGIDILISNAGIQRDSDFLNMSLDHWQKVIDTNLTGSFLCAREAARYFTEKGIHQGRSRAAGKIIFISSVHDEIPWAGRVNYTAAKGGLKMMMESLAQELAVKKIRVNNVSPGAIKTAINKEEWGNPEGEKSMLDKIPYGRIGEPEDIAKVVVWLASDEADYVTGTTIYVDGGMTLYPSFLE